MTQIKNRYSNAVIFAGEYPSLAAALIDAIKRNADLSNADLSDADLSDADLSDADLSNADLSDADLRNANLRNADLSDADLSDADLSNADLSYADLSNADLSYANLRDADLSNADLSDADLIGANLSNANLSNADLSDANLRNANLSEFRSDFLSEVLNLPNELEFLRAAIIEGKIDGSTYSGECACLAGTMAKAKGITIEYSGQQIKNGRTFTANASSPREKFFMAIKKGDTPETNPASKIALEWTDEAIAIRDNIRVGFVEIK